MSETKEQGIGKGRSRLLYQITSLLVIVLLIIGVTIFLVVNGAFNRLIEEDKRDRIDSEAQIIYNDAMYTTDTGITDILVDFPEMNVTELFMAVKEKRINEFIRYANDWMKDSVDKGMLGADALLIVDPSSRILPYPYVIVASDDDLAFTEIPDYITKAYDEGRTYLYLEEGIPELGFDGEYMISLVPLRNPLSPDEVVFLALRPFHEEAAHIDSFYNSERNRLTLILALVIGGGIVLVFLITFFILRRMIYKQITEPIDELTSVAGEVMDGNLDVEIDIREGEEFETLKLAFKEMLRSVRSMVERSIGGE